MAYRDSSREATNKYKSKFGLIQVRVEKEMLEKITAHAAAHGESKNAFIKRAIDETMKRDNSLKRTRNKNSL